MSETATQPAGGVPAVQGTSAVETLKKGECEFVPFGSAEKVRLSFDIIRKYVASPAKNGELPGDRDCMQFMMLCRNRALDPFAGDAYMVGYMDSQTDTVKWSLITAHQVFLKRAELNPDFDGMESGVIVRDKDGNVQERVGDFHFDDDRLLGGWAIVHRKSIKHPAVARVKLSTFNKGYSQWKTNPNGMICKCAEADALRRTFPTILGGMYIREEEGALDVEATVETAVAAKTPAFNSRKVRSAGAPVGLPAPPPTTAAPATPPVQQNEAVATSETPLATPKPIANEGKAGRSLAGGSVATAAPAKSAEQRPQTPQALAEGVSSPPQAPNEPPAQSAAAPAGESEEFKPNPNESDELQSLRFLAHGSKVAETQVMEFCRRRNFAKPDQKKLSDLSNAKLLTIAKGWPNFVTEIQAIPA